MVAGAGGAWLFQQLVSDLVQNGVLPQLAYNLSLNLVFWALAVTAVAAWYHGEKGRQEVPASERWILVALAGGWLATSVAVVLLEGP
jgi:hypothetical protein